jgi:streptogramin lyase
VRQISLLIALSAALVASGPAESRAQACTDPLCAGDVVVSDITLNQVYRLRCATPTSTNCPRVTLSSGGLLDTPRAIVVGPNGRLFVSESASADAVIRIDPALPETSNQVIVTNSGVFSSPRGIVIDASGDFLVAEPSDDAIYRVNPASGFQSAFSVAGAPPETFHFPSDIALEADGGLLVTDAPSLPEARRVLRVEPTGGIPSVLSKDGLLTFPRGIAIEANGNAVVADSGQTGPPAISAKLIRIDRAALERRCR